MADKSIRVGIVGAGANTRSRHIPGFRALSGVEVAGVANRSPESTAKAAAELGIPKTYPGWRELVADPAIDAVCIGTWPNMHCEITCAALEAGKHVLCEARMARTVTEARRMLAASRAHPDLVAQLVPSPFGLYSHPYVRKLIDGDYLGDLREIVVLGADDQFWDYSEPLHWRQDRNLSGVNVLTLGILHETLLRWAPPPVQVFAQTAIDEPLKPDPDKPGRVRVTVPDSVMALAKLPGNARAAYHFSGTILYGPGKQIHLYGHRGSMRVVFGAKEEVWLGRASDPAMQAYEIPEGERGGWRVEAEFVGAIRGEEQVQFTTFERGVQYMEFTEAVALSAAENRPVALPLP